MAINLHERWRIPSKGEGHCGIYAVDRNGLDEWNISTKDRDTLRKAFALTSASCLSIFDAEHLLNDYSGEGSLTDEEFAYADRVVPKKQPPGRTQASLAPVAKPRAPAPSRVDNRQRDRLRQILDAASEKIERTPRRDLAEAVSQLSARLGLGAAVSLGEVLAVKQRVDDAAHFWRR